MTQDEEILNLKADLAGAQVALGTAIRALIKTHPHPDALLAAIHREYQETLVLLTNGPMPDRALEAFHVSWELVGPEDPDAQPYGPPPG
ncbi:hypothetical protein AVHY2522_24660 [Acidovorax sp. SUPP2522]|uniref:hypothetical protein n=1 Tax=unclassified Acidovorax TaxID=2684926 RepID=UPI00234A3620|nr:MULTISPECIES: hypothetical protein [unclassified Acidovorax]WCM96253.1 hypothetical protein M5C96_17680 [Acidovorax sp. GBBC 1281]GKT20054.1 hypothetical protein AVHY2522_24660 [Acidovorax sp. SUPP2522]